MIFFQTCLFHIVAVNSGRPGNANFLCKREIKKHPWELVLLSPQRTHKVAVKWIFKPSWTAMKADIFPVQTEQKAVGVYPSKDMGFWPWERMGKETILLARLQLQGSTFKVYKLMFFLPISRGSSYQRCFQKRKEWPKLQASVPFLKKAGSSIEGYQWAFAQCKRNPMITYISCMPKAEIVGPIHRWWVSG